MIQVLSYQHLEDNPRFPGWALNLAHGWSNRIEKMEPAGMSKMQAGTEFRRIIPTVREVFP